MLFTKTMHCTGKCLTETSHAMDKELPDRYVFQCRVCGNLREWYKNSDVIKND